MTLADLSDLSQALGAVAVIASLVFVGIQVRQNSAITRAQVHQQISDTFTVYLETMANHSNIIAGGASSRAGMNRLSDEELLQFSFLMAGLFKIWENAFYQYKSGFLDERNWQSNVKWMLTWYHMPGVQTWWRVRKDLFANEFQVFIESSVLPVDDRSISEKLREAAQPLTEGAEG